MKYLSIFLYLGAMSYGTLLPFTMKSQSVFMTFNLRYDNPGDGFQDWNHRKESVVDIVHDYQPDILGTQEGLIHQLKYIDENLPEYSFFGKSRDDGKEKGEFSAIFYLNTRWKLLMTETIWLSDTREVGSKGWDAALPRIVTYGVLASKKIKDTLHILNAHFDHMGPVARQEASKLLLTIMQEKKLEHHKVIVMGDFNATADELPIQILKNYFDSSCLDYLDVELSGGTFNGFLDDGYPDRIIDHIFTQNLKVDTCRILTEKREDGGFISDHFPVFLRTR